MPANETEDANCSMEAATRIHHCEEMKLKEATYAAIVSCLLALSPLASKPAHHGACGQSSLQSNAQSKFIDPA